jgi:DNA relaxase NicK
MQQRNPKLVHAGVDWLTATCTQRESAELMRPIALALAEVQLANGYFGRPWNQSGYEGFNVGHVQYGERPDGCCVRLGSYMAQAHWHRCYEIADNVTRFDVAATFQYESDVAKVIQAFYAPLLRWSKDHGGKPEVSMLCDSAGSRTVYSGRRSSDVFGRIYDKGRESGLAQFDKCVRYEWELKGRRSKALAFDIFTNGTPASSIARYVLALFSKRGVCLRNEAKSLDDSRTIVHPQGSVCVTDVQRSLKWLRHCVGPTVQRLGQHLTPAEIFEALRLSPQN